MAKAIRSFYGTDTYGRHIEVVMSESENWFWREYCWNGYGKSWSRWSSYDEVPNISTWSNNHLRMEWGFNWLDETTPDRGEPPLRYRLPY